MMFATDRAFEVGQRVTIVEAPLELLAGLPPADQRAIRSLVGKPGIFEGIDPHGYVEIEFVLNPKRLRTIFVLAGVVAPYRDDD